MADEGPPIEPTTFDLIVLGTGLPECILAAAAAAASAGKSVLHIDSSDFYGSLWSSLPLDQFCSFLSSGGNTLYQSSQRSSPPSSNLQIPESSPQQQQLGFRSSSSSSVDEELDMEGLKAVVLNTEGSIYSDVSVSDYARLAVGEGVRSYNLDLAGPKLLMCGDSIVELLLRSRTNNYLEFKSVEATYIWSKGELVPVPGSRADVFKDHSLSLREKRFLMRFFKMVSDFAAASADGSTFELSAEQLEGPFVGFLHQQELPASIQAMILYAIAFADDDQTQQTRASYNILTTREGLERLAIYLSSVVRFPNASGAFLYPLYGQGELAQAFCRSAAVKGALYVLRRNVIAVVMEKGTSIYRGVRTGMGQVLYSQKLVVGSSLLSLQSFSNLYLLQTGSEASACGADTWSSGKVDSSPMSSEFCWKVARFVCITDSSLQSGQKNILIVFPPRSSSATFSSVVRALQLSSTSSVCPDGRFVVQFSTLCLQSMEAKVAIQSIVGSLFSSEDQAKDLAFEELEEKNSDLNKRPRILWSSFFVQPLSVDAKLQDRRRGLGFCALPNQALDYQNVLRSTEKMFHDLFEDSEWFPHLEAIDFNDDEVTESMEANSFSDQGDAGTVAGVDNKGSTL